VSFSEIPSLLIDEQVELRKHGDYESLSRAWTRYYLAKENSFSFSIRMQIPFTEILSVNECVPDVSCGGIPRIWREHPGIGVGIRSASEYSRYNGRNCNFVRSADDPQTQLRIIRGTRVPVFLLSFDSSCVWEFVNAYSEFVSVASLRELSPCESAAHNSDISICQRCGVNDGSCLPTLWGPTSFLTSRSADRFPRRTFEFIGEKAIVRRFQVG